MAEKVSAFLHNDQLEQLHYPADCPFDTSRAGKVHKAAVSMGLSAGADILQVSPCPATKEQLETFHTSDYLDCLLKTASGDFDADAIQMGFGTGDCPVFSDMFDYPALAAGATLTAAELILDGKADYAFNPSGGFHHAGPEKAAGFCYINDVAIVCEMLAQKGKRILYLDVDVHHSDGVQNQFYNRSDVMTVSFHQEAKTLFPHSGFVDEIGAGSGVGYCVNFPMIAGTYDEAYMKGFTEILPSIAEFYQPDVIVFELGADALAGDPLANLQLTNNSYVEIIKILQSLNKPILMTGGGGYHVENTVRAWTLAWATLSNAQDPIDLSIGMGGVMLETTDWLGGLRDRAIVIDDQQKVIVDDAVDQTIEQLKKSVFTIHNI